MDRQENQSYLELVDVSKKFHSIPSRGNRDIMSSNVQKETKDPQPKVDPNQMERKGYLVKFAKKPLKFTRL